MSTPFKLKSGNKPNKPGLFGIIAPALDRIIKKGKRAYNVYKTNKSKR